MNVLRRTRRDFSIGTFASGFMMWKTLGFYDPLEMNELFNSRHTGTSQKARHIPNNTAEINAKFAFCLIS